VLNRGKLKVYSPHFEVSEPRQGDAGIDLRTPIEVTLLPFGSGGENSQGYKVKVDTGVRVEIPEGYFGNIGIEKSSIGDRMITVLAGAIDSSYRGSIQIILVNLSKDIQVLKAGQKIGQLIVSPYLHCEVEQVNSPSELSTTERGEGGFGSTGI